MQQPVAGDQIRVNAGAYYHYGIYIGNDMVVQFGLPNNIYQKPETIRVIKSPIEDFLQGGFLEVRRYTLRERLKKRSNEKIVAYALKKLGTGGYDILRYNCQHFANECVFGMPSSDQVDTLRREVLEKFR